MRRREEKLMRKTPKTSRRLKVTHVHHKPYRKRHYGLLLLSTLAGIVLGGFVVSWYNQTYISQQIAAQTIADTTPQRPQSAKVTITSTYGFAVNYDTNKYSASAVDRESGNLFAGPETATSRAYSALSLSAQSLVASNGASVKINYYPDDANAKTPAAIESAYLTKQANTQTAQKTASSDITINGITYHRTDWSRKAEGKATVSVGFTTYGALVHDRPFTVVVYHGLASDAKSDDIIKGISLSDKNAAMAAPLSSISRYHSSLTLLDRMMGTSTVAAASPSYTSSERISATYGAAVVKVYNVLFGDIQLDGQTILPQQLLGGTGSGFIISGDGYIGTNGHVVVNDPREETFMVAVTEAGKGDMKPLVALLSLTSLTSAELSGAKSDADQAAIIVNALYSIPTSRFSFANSKTNLLVGLAEDQVDIQELVDDTTNGRTYPTTDTIKTATLKTSDFGGILRPALTGKFTNSDVALIKLEGKNYPMVKLGDISSLTQGSNLNIMGFPGIGSSTNGLVSQTSTTSTLTTGKVSAIKNDTNSKKLVETDTEIGHGNSGGPAFNDNGEVIGIATYSAATGKAGDGVLNYVRDIQDFKDLAAKQGVDYTVSETQREWNQGIDLYYKAHYKSAVSHFAKVKELYPADPRVDELTKTANKRIANGENVDDFPVAVVIIVALVVLAGTGVSVFLILQHKKKHLALVQAVAKGQAQPMQPGIPAQYVSPAVSTAQILAQSPQPVSQPFTPPVAPVSPTQPSEQPLQQPPSAPGTP